MGGCFWVQTSWFGVRTPEHPKVPKTVPSPPKCLFSAGSLLLEGALLLLAAPAWGARGGPPGAGGGARGRAAGRIPAPSFPPLLTGCKVPAIPLRGAAVRTHSTKVPGAAGGARWPGWESQVGGTAAAPPPPPTRPPRCARWAPAGCRARGKQTWASWAGRGVRAPFEAPIKEPSIKGGESQRNKESG